MRKIRKISLQNASGQRFHMDGTQGVYASNLTGLGFSLDPVFADLQHGFFLPVSAEFEPQQHPAFTVTFTRNAYQMYKRFVDWVASAGALTLVYQPFGEAEYFRDIAITSVQKGELNAVGWLEAPCSCVSATPWYLPAPTVLSLEDGSAEGIKRYPYTYTEDLRYGSDSMAALSGTIFPTGHIPGALDIAYSGGIINPRIRLTGNVSGKTYGICTIAATLEPSDTLRFSSRYERSFVSKIAAGGGETDLLDDLDLSTEPFFHIPVDEPCTLSIESDSLIPGKATVQVYYYFRSV